MGALQASRQERQTLRFLLCDSSSPHELHTDSGEVVQSAIRCLDVAVDGSPDIVAVRFGTVPIWEGKALVRLCAALKRNSHTQRIPVLALLHKKHRVLLEVLAQAGVDYIKIIDERGFCSTMVEKLIEELGPDDRSKRQLAALCPHLHYQVVNPQHEMVVCGAYRDRMAPVAIQLHETCETDNHLECEYFLSPRSQS